MADTWTIDQPQCPECGWSNQDWWDGLKGGETRVEWECICGTECVSEIEYQANFQTKIRPTESIDPESLRL